MFIIRNWNRKWSFVHPSSNLTWMSDDRECSFEMSDELAGSNFREGLNVAWTKANDSLVTIGY